MSDLSERVHQAVDAVDDPEYPGVGIGELGMVVDVRVSDGGDAEVDLIPTFLGCPALGFIALDVENAAAAVEGVHSVHVRWRHDVAWDSSRVSDTARHRLAADYTVAVSGHPSGPTCPVCGSAELEVVSDVSASRCRAISRCLSCGERIEVIRG